MIFQSKRGKPRKFTFSKSLPDSEKSSVIQMIEANGGKVVDFDVKDASTIVLGDEVKTSFIVDCLKSKRFLVVDHYKVGYKAQEDSTGAQGTPAHKDKMSDFIYKSTCKHIQEDIKNLEPNDDDHSEKMKRIMLGRMAKHGVEVCDEGREENISLYFSASQQMKEIQKCLAEKELKNKQAILSNNENQRMLPSTDGIKCTHLQQEPYLSSAKKQMTMIKKLLLERNKQAETITNRQKNNQPCSKSSTSVDSTTDPRPESSKPLPTFKTRDPKTPSKKTIGTPSKDFKKTASKSTQKTASKEATETPSKKIIETPSKETKKVPNPFSRSKKRVPKAPSNESSEIICIDDSPPLTRSRKLSATPSPTKSSQVQNTEAAGTSNSEEIIVIPESPIRRSQRKAQSRNKDNSTEKDSKTSESRAPKSPASNVTAREKRRLQMAKKRIIEFI